MIPSRYHHIESRITPILTLLEQELENIALECEIEGINDWKDIETLLLLAKQRPLRKHIGNMFNKL